MRTEMRNLALAAMLVSVPPTVITAALANSTARDTTPAPRAQVVEDDDFDEWGLLGLLGLAGLLGLRRRKDDRDDPTAYTDKDYVGKTGYDRRPGV
jgi:MYXO-CTERM domain-containing protein